MNRRLDEMQLRQLVRRLISEIADSRDMMQPRPDVMMREFYDDVVDVNQSKGVSTELDSGIDNVTGLMRDVIRMTWVDEYTHQSVVTSIYSKDNGYLAECSVEVDGATRLTVPLRSPESSPAQAFRKLIVLMGNSNDEVVLAMTDVFDA